jgi:type II secretory pathway pseudopilin PulG
MSKYRSGKRYADILTVLLVIVIIAILGLLAYFGYKIIDKKNVETTASDALEEFKKNTPTLAGVSDTVEDGSIISDGESDLNTIIDNNKQNTTANSTSTSSNIKKTYLGNYEIKGSISIPKTGIEYPILEKATIDSLKKSVAILDIIASSELDTTVNDLNVQGTNAFILGHNYRNGMFF